MWVFTDSGFVSAVEHWSDPTCLVIRARDRASLDAMIDSIESTDFEMTVTKANIFSQGGTDYKWRVFLSKPAFATFLANEACNISYPNFKSRVTKTRGQKWHDALMNVWVSMLRVEDGPKKEKKYRTSSRWDGHDTYEDDVDVYARSLIEDEDDDFSEELKREYPGLFESYNDEKWYTGHHTADRIDISHMYNK